jgi:hypothetical protein
MMMHVFLSPRLHRPSPECRVGHLLVVAGPSGSGKSEFLRQLAARRLPAEIASVLPIGASSWPQTNGRRMVRGRLPPGSLWNAGGGLPGLVLHYDFLRPFETAIRDFSSDPSLGVLAWAEEASVAVVSMRGDGLAARLAARPPKRRPIGRVLARLFHRLGLRTREKRRRVYDPATEHARHRRLVELYLAPGFLEGWEARWLDYVGAALGPRLRLPIARIDSGSAGSGGFQLAGDASAIPASARRS